jgi:Ca2+:H+ antiporter
VTRRDIIELGIAAVLVLVAAALHYAHAAPVVTFLGAALAIAMLARLVGGATEQLGGRLGSSVAGVVQSGLGNLPELFIALFALHDGLILVVQAALVGSVIANSVLVLGLAFLVGGVRNGTQRFSSMRARMIATLTTLAATILAFPTLAHAFHTPAAAHEKSLSLICAGVLIVLFVLTLPGFLAGGDEHAGAAPRWSLATTVAVLGAAGVGAAFVSDWFVTALKPATEALGMSQAFAGLVVVAIAGNAVENVTGIVLARKGRNDLAISVVKNSVAQIAAFLFPVLVLVSLLFAHHLTFALDPVYIGALLVTALAVWQITGDGEAVAFEGWALVAIYVVLAALTLYE